MMTCVDGRRAEDGVAPAAGGCAGGRAAAWLMGGRDDVAQATQKSRLRAVANIHSLTTTPGHSDPAEIAAVDLIWNPVGQRRPTV